MKIEIMTCNSEYDEDGQCIGGYHEIHTINYLQNIGHIIATIDSVINNNLLYGCDNTVLENVVVSCDNETVIKQINDHYEQSYVKVKVEAEFALML